MRRLLLVAGVLLLLSLSVGGLVWTQRDGNPGAFVVATPSQPTISTTSASYESNLRSLYCPLPPGRDLYELTERLRLGGSQTIPRAVAAAPPDYGVGHQETFWLTNMETYAHFTTTATLRYRTSNAYFYVEDGVEISEADLQRAAEEFENHIYPTIRRHFGSEWKPGVNSDLRLTILNARIPGVGGYYSVADEYPALVNPYSNQRKMIYINVGAVRPGMPSYGAVLAHELVHAVHWNNHPNEEGWVSEGLAELGAKLASYRSGLDRAFLARPDTQLTTWPDELRDTAPHYGAAFLFLDYLASRTGGYKALPETIGQSADGIFGLETYLASLDLGLTFDDIFRDWVVANYLDLPGDGPYSYPNSEVHVTGVERLAEFGQRSGTVHPYATDYVEVRVTGDAILRFAGQPDSRLLPNSPRTGSHQWWSNRGDGINSTLTREFDLTSVAQATLRFWLWYDIERNWDYAYVEVSEDGGKTWTILSGRHSVHDNPLGNSMGPGYTGKSGGGQQAIWMEEAIDLTPYAGKKVLVRFEYVTDEGVNNHGLALDDISIPEIGYEHSAEVDDEWVVRGFVRSDNLLPQRFVVRVIKLGPTVSVEDVPLDARQQGQLELRGLGDEVEGVVLVIASTTPCTTLPAEYKYSIEKLP